MEGVEEGQTSFRDAPRTVADRIRELDRAGYSRAEIARTLGKRYQHVRNVLEADRVKAGRAPPDPAGDSGAEAVADMPGRVRFVLGKGGVLILPESAQKVLGVGPGDVILGLIEGEDITLTGGRVAMRRAREMTAHLRRPGWEAIDDFIAERYAEQAREDAKSEDMRRR